MARLKNNKTKVFQQNQIQSNIITFCIEESNLIAIYNSIINFFTT